MSGRFPPPDPDIRHPMMCPDGTPHECTGILDADLPAFDRPSED